MADLATIVVADSGSVVSATDNIVGNCAAATPITNIAVTTIPSANSIIHLKSSISKIFCATADNSITNFSPSSSAVASSSSPATAVPKAKQSTVTIKRPINAKSSHLPNNFVDNSMIATTRNNDSSSKDTDAIDGVKKTHKNIVDEEEDDCNDGVENRRICSLNGENNDKKVANINGSSIYKPNLCSQSNLSILNSSIVIENNRMAELNMTSTKLPSIRASTTSPSSSTIAAVSGPVSHSLSATSSATTDDLLLDELSRFNGALPIQPEPLLMPSDMSYTALRSTSLNGQYVSCFLVGGECRICFPQIISVILQHVAIDVVNDSFIMLNIHISVATPQQLDTLKYAGVMPMSVDSCGLITKSDAERLVAKLIPQSSGPLQRQVSRDADVAVWHDCFGGCGGHLVAALVNVCCDSIECDTCKLMFSGEKFVTHTHSLREIRRTCHWGFDSANWRHLIHSLDDERDSDNSWSDQLLRQFKAFPDIENGAALRPIKRPPVDSKVDMVDSVPSKVPNAPFPSCSINQLSDIQTASVSNGEVPTPMLLQSRLALQWLNQLQQSLKFSAPLTSSLSNHWNNDTILKQLMAPRTTDSISGIAESLGLSLQNLLAENLRAPELTLARRMLFEIKNARDRELESVMLLNDKLLKENVLLRSALSNSANILTTAGLAPKLTSLLSAN